MTLTQILSNEKSKSVQKQKCYKEKVKKYSRSPIIKESQSFLERYKRTHVLNKNTNLLIMVRTFLFIFSMAFLFILCCTFLFILCMALLIVLSLTLLLWNLVALLFWYRFSPWYLYKL